MPTAADSPAPPNAAGWRLQHSYTALPELCFAAVSPTAVRNPQLILLNHGLAAELGLAAGPGGLALAELAPRAAVAFLQLVGAVHSPRA